jgi:hypothetical protein
MLSAVRYGDGKQERRGLYPGWMSTPYPRQGGEQYDFDFGYFRAAMEHVRHVLENMDTYLIEAYGQNEEWEDIQNSY